VKRAALIFCCLVISASCFAVESVEKPREWIMTSQAVFNGTFVKYEDGFMYVKLLDGTVRKFPKAMGASETIGYVQNRISKFPALMSRPQISLDKNLLIDLTVDDLAQGPLSQWTNKGALGGAFHALNVPPNVREVAGRKCVYFDSCAWAVPMEFQAMVADFFTPKDLDTLKPFTVTAWLYNPSPLGIDGTRETLLAWQPMTGDDGTQIGYGSEGRYYFEKGLNGGAIEGPMGGMGFPDACWPTLNAWHHIAYVYTGARDGKLLLYVDGKLGSERTFDRNIFNAPATDIGKTEAALNADMFLRDGKPVKVTAFIGESDGKHWRWPEMWLKIIDLGLQSTSKISTKVTGLKPGTKYYYRFYLSTPDLPSGMESRWSDGAATFVTASEDGAPGKQIEKTDDKYMFLGCNWGINWVWDTKPNWLYTGGVGDIRVYQGALSEREIRNVYGKFAAYEPGPANASETDDIAVTLKWKPGASGVESYNVYLSQDKAAVESRSASAKKGLFADTTLDAGKLDLGKTYYWAVDEQPKDGATLADEAGKGEVWSFTVQTARATVPVPADSAKDALIYTGRLKWKPGKYVDKQKVYFGAERKSVENGTTKFVSPELGNQDTSWNMRDNFPNLQLQYGRTYYWRVDEINANSLPVTKGDVWQFAVGNYFEPEFDGLVSEPFPRSIRQDGYYGKLMECMGQPVVAAADCPEKPMRTCSYCVSKFLLKRPDIADVMEALNCGSHLDYGDRGWGSNEFTMQTYGSTRTYDLDPTFYWGINIMMHEMGHQFHMYGAEQTDNDFRAKLWDLYQYDKAHGMWVGDYGANNPWEYIAVCASAFCSDGSEDEVISRRETLRNNDPAMFYLLSEIWPGDTIIDLQPLNGLTTDANGKVLSWANQGGEEYWGKFGLSKYSWTTGRFRPIGFPRLTTVSGVSSVVFNGSSAMVWDKTTREALIGNHAWAIELWADCIPEPPNSRIPADKVLLSWGNLGKGVTLSWNQFENRPALIAWHHIVCSFKGGGLEDTEGEYRLYVDGKLDSTSRRKLDIPSGLPVVVGAVLDGDVVKSGFWGALAQVRVYDYDLSDLQVKKHYADEKAFYAPELTPWAGDLLVDLDARQLAPCPSDQVRPLYPASTGRDWVRSWYNKGLLGGKMSNDRREPENSDPKLNVVAGVDAIEFREDDRMVSSFTPSNMMLAAPALGLQAWVYRYPSDKQGTILQWGGIELTGKQIQPGAWHLIALTIGGSSTKLYIDGRLVSAGKPIVRPGESDRLHFGAHWDGWKWSNYFDGAIAQVRLLRDFDFDYVPYPTYANFSSSEHILPSHPVPANGAKIAAERHPVLSWQPGVRSSGRFYDVYLSTDQSQVSAAAKNAKCYIGRAAPGTLAPSLQPGKTYYWRVDALDTKGDAALKGPIWSFQTYSGKVVDLDASKLTSGKLQTWPNAGQIGGKFTAGAYGSQAAPTVVTMDGRKCLDFTNSKCLVSSFNAPATLTGTSPFTVSVWAYKRWFDESNTLLSWGNYANGSAEFNYGFGKDNGAFRSFNGFSTGFTGPYDTCDLYKNNSPMMLFWEHITYTYSGGPDGALKIYVNGILNTEKKAALKTAADSKIAIGGMLNPDGRWDWPYSGFISDVVIYDKALDQDAVKYLFDGSGAKPDDANCLVKLACDDLTSGKLASWKNKGKAGGEFGLPARKPSEPIAGIVAGRKAVTFDGRSTFMQSSFNAPASLTWRNPFTVETWIYNPTIDYAETFFSMAPRLAFTSTMLEDYIKRAAEFRYGSGDDRTPAAFYTGWDYHSTGWIAGKAPEAGKWRHIAYVCDGQRQGTLTIYVDGVPVHKREWFTLATTPNLPMFLGTAWNTETGASDMFSGSIAGLKVFDYAKTAAEVKASAANSK